MKISVIIPCFNVERYITSCLTSVLRQTWPEIEIICVNDGSVDGTTEKIHDFCRNHNCNLKIFHQKQSGAPAARNKGLEMAGGEYIQFLDADDLLLCDKLSHQAELINRAETRPDIIAADFLLVRENGQKSVIRSREKRPLHALLCKNLGITSSNLWRKEALEKVSGFDTNLDSAQEYDLMFRLLKNDAEVLFDDEPYTIKRDRASGSVSQTNRKENRLRFIDLQLRVLQYMRESGRLDSRFEEYFYQKLLYEIRLLHNIDADEALGLHEKLIPRTFRLRLSPETTMKYVVLYRLFGYRIAQKIWQLYARYLKQKVLQKL